MAQMNLTKDWGFDFNANTYFGMEYGLKSMRWDFTVQKNYPVLNLSYEKRNGVIVNNLGLFFKKNATESDIKFLDGKVISNCILRWGCSEAIDEETGEVLRDKDGNTVLHWADKPSVVALMIAGTDFDEKNPYVLHGHLRKFKEPAVIEEDPKSEPTESEGNAEASADAPADAE